MGAGLLSVLAGSWMWQPQLILLLLSHAGAAAAEPVRILHGWQIVRGTQNLVSHGAHHPKMHHLQHPCTPLDIADLVRYQPDTVHRMPEQA